MKQQELSSVCFDGVNSLNKGAPPKANEVGNQAIVSDGNLYVDIKVKDLDRNMDAASLRTLVGPNFVKAIVEEDNLTGFSKGTGTVVVRASPDRTYESVLKRL